MTKRQPIIIITDEGVENPFLLPVLQSHVPGIIAIAQSAIDMPNPGDEHREWIDMCRKVVATLTRACDLDRNSFVVMPPDDALRLHLLLAMAAASFPIRTARAAAGHLIAALNDEEAREKLLAIYNKSRDEGFFDYDETQERPQ